MIEFSRFLAAACVLVQYGETVVLNAVASGPGGLHRAQAQAGDEVPVGAEVGVEGSTDDDAVHLQHARSGGRDGCVPMVGCVFTLPGSGVDGRVPATCTIEVEDIQATAEELKSRGVEFSQEPTQQPYGIDLDNAPLMHHAARQDDHVERLDDAEERDAGDVDPQHDEDRPMARGPEVDVAAVAGPAQRIGLRIGALRQRRAAAVLEVVEAVLAHPRHGDGGVQSA